MLGNDYSTLNIPYLKSLDIYHKPPTYQLSDSLGQGCFLDAPGYPSYFLRSVYTQYGNSPRKGAEYVITLNGISYIIELANWCNTDTWDSRQARFQRRLRKLWKPLPLEHPRVQAWIDYCRRYFRNCYVDPRKPESERTHAEQLHIGLWGVREFSSLADALGIELYPALRDVCNGNEENYSQEELAAITPGLQRLAAAIIARTDRATSYIQGFYPDYQYEPFRPYVDKTGDWWETLAERPTPENCPGEIRWGRGHGHPVNTSWCQVCGWSSEVAA